MEELRIGLVGTGAIGRTHIERINNTLQGGRVVACADANIDFCKSVADKYGTGSRCVQAHCRAGDGYRKAAGTGWLYAPLRSGLWSAQEDD